MRDTKRLSKTFNDVFAEGYSIKKIFDGVSDDTPSLMVKTITFQVTEQCSLACTYCYETHKTNKRMDLETAKKFIDLLIEDSYKEDSFVYIGHTKALILEFIGGEPLLEIDLIHEIMDYFLYKTTKEKHIWATNFMISMISNGISYFDPRVQDLFFKYKNRLSFSISMDGCKELHDSCRVFPDGSGSYDLAMAAVHHYHEIYGGTISSKVTLSPDNIKYTSKALIHLIEQGYKNINCNCVFEKGWNYTHATIFYNELKVVADYLLNNNLTNTHTISLFEENFFCPLPIEDDKNWCGGNG